MLDPDVALANLKQILKDFAAFYSRRCGASEADTRVKVIDWVLTGVLGWPESNISREDHVPETLQAHHRAGTAREPGSVVLH